MPEQASRSDGGSFVRTARLKSGLTLRQLAAAIGVSTGTMSAIENGKVSLTVERLRQIAHALEVPASDLLSPPRPENSQAPASHATSTAEWRAFPAIDLDPVLASAVEVFLDTGYHGATMRLIAAGAEISVAGIYHYYPSKKHLLIALISRAHEDLRWRLESAAADGANASAAFVNMVEALVLFREHRRSLAFVMVTEAHRVEAPVEADPAPDRRDIRSAFDQAAHRAVQAGEFSQTEPNFAITAILTMCLAPPTWTGSTPATDPETLARTYAELALSMMQPVHHQQVQAN